ncbi:MAG: nucleotide exchange factor GrpE [Sulfurospirillum sp.]|nr:nucleotide exchange factor GrpE [Sulfurospirillum sp.]
MSTEKKDESIQEELVMQQDEVIEETFQEETEEENLPDELTLLRDQVKQLEDKYLRANAEFENLKKRLEREKMQAIAYSNELFARDMLGVLDALDAASTIKESEDSNPQELFVKIKEGIDLTIEQCKKAFEKHGLEMIEANGEFDPNFHEAVMQLDSEEKKQGEILQVFQKGYKIKDRVIRPAMVSIVK